MIIYLLIVCTCLHSHDSEQYFYQITIPEIVEAATPAEKQEIMARLKEIERLNKEIQQIQGNKIKHQVFDLLLHNTLTDTVNHHPQKNNRNN